MVIERNGGKSNEIEIETDLKRERETSMMIERVRGKKER
jgi:hypothetical protein